jgi:hypothetical protein
LYVAGRAFVKVANTPSNALEKIISVRFVIPTELAKQLKSWLER